VLPRSPQKCSTTDSIWEEYPKHNQKEVTLTRLVITGAGNVF